MINKHCPRCKFHTGVYPENGKCPNCGRDWDLPTLDELEQMSAAIPVPISLELIDWPAIFGSLRDSLYLVSLVTALERRRIEQRDPSDNPH